MVSKLANLFLRIAIGGAFLYPPIDAIRHPDSWIGYLPGFTRGIVPELVLLRAFGILEIVIALWILSGWKIFLPSLVAAILLFSIAIFNFSQMEVVFRDLALGFAALALTTFNSRSGG